MTGFDPSRPAERVGARPLAPRAGQDRPPDHALPRRGAAARRSGRGASGGRDREDGPSVRADRLVRPCRDPLPRRGETVVVETEELTRTLHELTGPPLAEAASSTGSKSSCDARRRLPRPDGRRMTHSLASAEGRAADLLAQPGAGGLHLHLPAPALRAARLALRRRDRAQRGRYQAADVLLAGMIGYGAANTAFAGLAITLVVRREYGILKRLARRRCRARPTSAPCSHRR